MAKNDIAWEAIRELADMEKSGGLKIASLWDAAVCLVKLSDQFARLYSRVEKKVEELRHEVSRQVISEVSASFDERRDESREAARDKIYHDLGARIEALEGHSHVHSGLSRASSCGTTKGWKEEVGKVVSDVAERLEKTEPEPEVMTIPKMVARVFGRHLAFKDLKNYEQDYLKQQPDFPHVFEGTMTATCRPEDWVEMEQPNSDGCLYVSRYKDVAATHRFMRWLARG